MAREFKHVKVGEELRCSHINSIFDELNRWRKMRGAGLVDVDGADGTSPPTIVGYAAAAEPIPAAIKSGNPMAAGSQSSPSTTTVSLLVPSGSGDGLTAGADVQVLNYSTRAITAAGKLVYLARVGNRLHFLVGDC